MYWRVQVIKIEIEIEIEGETKIVLGLNRNLRRDTDFGWHALL